jgi:hypothetical protein
MQCCTTNIVMQWLAFTCSHLLKVDEAEEVGAAKAKGLGHFVLDGGRPGQPHEGALKRGRPAQTHEGAALGAACMCRVESTTPHLLLTAVFLMHTQRSLQTPPGPANCASAYPASVTRTWALQLMFVACLPSAECGERLH